MLCPRCDFQGAIYKARVVDLNLVLHICDECEACWKEGEVVNLSNFKDLSTFLEKRGLDYSDAKIEILEEMQD